MARPSKYSQALVEIICARISEGESLRTICKDPSMPGAATVFVWLADKDKPEFQEQYACAREAQADKYAEEIISIADDGKNDTYLDEDGNERTNQDVIARSRLRVDARKWYASKLAPKKYGDKVTQEHTGVDGKPIDMNISLNFVKPKPKDKPDGAG